MRRRDTDAELVIRRRLHAAGFRYRVDHAPVDGLRSRPDIVFGRSRLAVFIDGCFWHGCPVHGTQPKSNAAWWKDKIAANKARDRAADAKLQDAGWLVLRFWAHEDPAAVVEAIARTVRSRRPPR